MGWKRSSHLLICLCDFLVRNTVQYITSEIYILLGQTHNYMRSSLASVENHMKLTYGKKCSILHNKSTAIWLVPSLNPNLFGWLPRREVSVRRERYKRTVRESQSWHHVPLVSRLYLYGTVLSPSLQQRDWHKLRHRIRTFGFSLRQPLFWFFQYSNFYPYCGQKCWT